jgi:two-component system chemotaxis response regulator CheY
MEQKSKAQMEQERLMEASGLAHEDLEVLYEECRDKLAEVESDLMDAVESKVAVSPEFINRVFRAIHTVKGAACHLVHEPMKNLSQAAENVLSQARDGAIDLNPAIVDVLLAAVARLEEMAWDVDRRMDIDDHLELARLKAVLKPERTAAVRDLDGRSSVPAPLRALVVEDELTSRLILQDLLSKYGVCHVAVNGAEAVDAFRCSLLSGQRYDLICMDIRMPVMDGTEAVRHIRWLEEQRGIYSSDGVKIFMTTSIRDVRTVTRAFKELCDGYLFKPIDGAELKETLADFRLISAVDGVCASA